MKFLLIAVFCGLIALSAGLPAYLPMFPSSDPQVVKVVISPSETTDHSFGLNFAPENGQIHTHGHPAKTTYKLPISLSSLFLPSSGYNEVSSYYNSGYNPSNTQNVFVVQRGNQEVRAPPVLKIKFPISSPSFLNLGSSGPSVALSPQSESKYVIAPHNHETVPNINTDNKLGSFLKFFGYPHPEPSYSTKFVIVPPVQQQAPSTNTNKYILNLLQPSEPTSEPNTESYFAPIFETEVLAPQNHQQESQSPATSDSTKEGTTSTSPNIKDDETTTPTLETNDSQTTVSNTALKN